MNDPDTQPSDKPSKRFQFSLGSILIWTAIVCLTVNNVTLSRKLEDLTRAVESSRPLSVHEVADQFERRTTLGPIETAVKDVRYSEEQDAFLVEFQWVDSTTDMEWSSSVELESNDFGNYHGRIRNEPFIKPLGCQDGFMIVVESPSAFDQQNPNQ